MTAVTYIRDCDRTRLIYVFDLPLIEAEDRAAALAPRGFRKAAVCEPEHREMHIPMDGDNYGAEVVPPHWTPAAVA